MKAIERAVQIAGGQSKLAERIGGNVKQAHVWNWLNKSDGVVPAEHCRAIEDATEGQVTRYELRPDVFGDPPPVSQQAAEYFGPERRQMRG